MISFSSTKWNRFLIRVIPVNVTRMVNDSNNNLMFPNNHDNSLPNGFMNRVNQWRDKCWIGPYLCLERLLRIASLFKMQPMTSA